MKENGWMREISFGVRWEKKQIWCQSNVKEKCLISSVFLPAKTAKLLLGLLVGFRTSCGMMKTETSAEQDFFSYHSLLMAPQTHSWRSSEVQSDQSPIKQEHKFKVNFRLLLLFSSFFFFFKAKKCLFVSK